MMKRSLYTILGELALTSPKLVLVRGFEYSRIEDLWSRARRDLKMGASKDRVSLSEPIYWTELDVRGKLLLKGITKKGDEFVAFVEPGSDVQTSPI